MGHAVHETIQRHLPEIAALCRAHDVERLDVFGSAARGDEDFDPSRSDVDLLVRFKDDHGRLEAWARMRDLQPALEQVLGRHVDLVREGSIRNPYILRTVEEDRIPIYEA